MRDEVVWFDKFSGTIARRAGRSGSAYRNGEPSTEPEG
jgi:hypothetical protein